MSDEIHVVIGKSSLILYDSRSVCFGRGLSNYRWEKAVTAMEKKQGQILKRWIKSFKGELK